MSYVNLDDQHEQGRLTQFRERLSGEVRMQTGEPFDIFQDRKDIAWGQQWQERIDESLNAVTFLIPIITPGFFKSTACREELERFLKREEELGRGDLILPVYYVNCLVLRDKAKRKHDKLAQIIAARQYEDWRELRFEEFTSSSVRKALAKMAEQIVAALEQRQEKTSVPHPEKKSEVVERNEAEAVLLQSEKINNDYVTPQPTPAAKTKQPTVIVDQNNRGDYATITEALETVKAGTRILVRPGLYKESIVVDKRVEIIGDGERSKIVIAAHRRNAIFFTAENGRVVNLTLRQLGGGCWYCVNIAQGELELEDCDISSKTGSCIAIHGRADPTLRRNRIHDGKCMGVYVYDNGQGTLEDNEIFTNEGYGVDMTNCGNSILRRNRIYDGKAGGVAISGGGQVTLEDNEIFANKGYGVVITCYGNPILRRNCIIQNGDWGIAVGTDSGIFEDNDLRGNAKGAWYIAAYCKPNVRRRDNKE